MMALMAAASVLLNWTVLKPTAAAGSEGYVDEMDFEETGWPWPALTFLCVFITWITWTKIHS